jgi:3-dehydroquinate dehydratase-1
LRLYAQGEQPDDIDPIDSSNMSILVISGARSLDHSMHCIPKGVVSQLVEHAALAGKTIAVRGCASEADVVRCLHCARDDGAELVLVDPGPYERSDGCIARALEDLPVPYIEVHDDHFDALEARIPAEVGHPLHVVQGYGAQSYVLALAIALEHLGCAECENNVHVGT